MFGQARKRKGCCPERGLSGWGRCIRCVREGRGGEPREGKAEIGNVGRAGFGRLCWVYVLVVKCIAAATTSKCLVQYLVALDPNNQH
jgi:hypothetical protein